MKYCFSLLVCALAASVQVPSAVAQISEVSLQVMLRPSLQITAVEQDILATDIRQKLETLLAQPVHLTGVTKAGALRLTVPLAAQNTKALVRALRADPDVLWASEEISEAVVKAEPLTTLPKQARKPSREILLRLNDGVVADWDILLPRLIELTGQPLVVDRPIGKLWLLTLPQAQYPATLRALTDRLQKDPAVKYADPGLHMTIQITPNDPYFNQQWALTDPLSGINVLTAWGFTTGNPFVTVAVIDTGILPHPDLHSARILPGYDFISDSTRARDGDGRDSNPYDEGDWDAVSASSWHGTFVAGQILANGNNGTGIAGVDWQAKLLPVRALGLNGGTWGDIMDALRWAVGLQVQNAPINRNPAKVINMSLGGVDNLDGWSCSAAWQEVVDEVLAQGSTIVASAGNESSPARLFVPASCNGVISVGATGVDGDKATYSNYGNRVDISAPGGSSIDPYRYEQLIVSIYNAGKTTPSEPSYGYMQGTSMAAPHVAGIASLLKGYNSTLTPSQILNLLQTTARQFPEGADCLKGDHCGAGLVDAGLALAAAIPTTPKNAVKVIEYYHAGFDHYFITAYPEEIAHIDRHPEMGWTRTGGWFWAYSGKNGAPENVQPVCRFFATWPGEPHGTSSHFYSGYQDECGYVRSRWQGVWLEETPEAFYIQVPDSQGNCPAYTMPVYRLFNNRLDANHRYTIDINDRYAMVNRGWALEGSGRDVAGFCMPLR